jgi:glycosyltransferase involved in cell wall biosynthesis
MAHIHTTPPKRITYLVLANVAHFPFNTLFVRGLEENGVTVTVIKEEARGLSKYWRSMHALWLVRGSSDAFCVGYLSHRLVPCAYLIARLTGKKIYFNAGHSTYDQVALDQVARQSWWIHVRAWILDYLSFHLCDLAFVESNAQRAYLHKLFYVCVSKLSAISYGADDSILYRTPADKLHDPSVMTVLWRGAMLPFVDTPVAFEAMRLLRDDPGIRFVVRGGGPIQPLMRTYVKENSLSNVEFTDHHFTDEELRELMVSADVMFGIYGSTSRGDCTIPNRMYEAIMLGIPFVTVRTQAVAELMTEGEHCLFVRPHDSRGLADKIVLLKNDPALRARLSANLHRLYEEKLTSRHLGESIVHRMR